MAAANNQLTSAEQYRLNKWIEASSTECKFLTHAEVAERASAALGFVITLSNVATSRNVTGVEWTGRRGKKSNDSAGSRLYYVAKDLIATMEALGMEPNERVRAIVNKHGR